MRTCCWKKPNRFAVSQPLLKNPRTPLLRVLPRRTDERRSGGLVALVVVLVADDLAVTVAAVHHVAGIFVLDVGVVVVVEVGVGAVEDEVDEGLGAQLVA